MARMTVKAAAKALGVSPDVLESYLERTGKLQEIRRGRRVFIPAEEVKALLREQKGSQGAASPVQETTIPHPPDKSPPLEAPPISMERYEALLEEIGRLKYQTRLLEQYRREVSEKNALLLEKEARIARLEAELAFWKRPWWRRLFSSGTPT